MLTKVWTMCVCIVIGHLEELLGRMSESRFDDEGSRGLFDGWAGGV